MSRLAARYSIHAFLSIGLVFALFAETSRGQDPEPEVEAGALEETGPELTPDQIALRDKLIDCLDFYYYEYPLNSRAQFLGNHAHGDRLWNRRGARKGRRR